MAPVMGHNKYNLLLGSSAWHNVQIITVSELCCLLNTFILEWPKGKLPIADTGTKKRVRTYGMLETPSLNQLSEHLLLR